MRNSIVSRIFSFKRISTVLSLGVLAVGCSRAEESASVQEFTGPQLYGTGMSDGTLTLTFDDGPGPRTAELSRYLKQEGIQGTFFIQGSAAAAYPEVLKQLHEDGHLLANHTYTHPRMTASTDPVSEVRRTDDLIKKYITDGVFLFRAPYGDWNGKVAAILNNAGLTKYVGSIFWDIGGVRTERPDKRLDTAADWACWSFNDSVEKCADGYMNEIRNLSRGIVLMHDVHSRTIDMVKNMVPRLKNEGYRFVRLDKAPTVAAALARRTNTGDLPPPALACPAGFAPTDVGTQGGKLCVSETEASGPFTQGMITACLEKGGGDACGNARWSRGLAVWLHGPGRCPVGAAFDATLNACLEGDNAFGPFNEAQVKACKNASADPNSPACVSNRWSKSFLASITK